MMKAEEEVTLCLQCEIPLLHLAHFLTFKITYPQWTCLQVYQLNSLAICSTLLILDQIPKTCIYLYSILGVSVADDFLSSTGSNSYNSSRVRMLEFNVQHGDRIIHLKVSV